VKVGAGGKVYPPVFVGGGGGSFLGGLVAFWRRLFTDFVSALRVDLISLISSDWWSIGWEGGAVSSISEGVERNEDMMVLSSSLSWAEVLFELKALQLAAAARKILRNCVRVGG
jgi:hypothetical protein